MWSLDTKRFDNRHASDLNEAITRIEVENTWSGGAAAVERAIATGALLAFTGPGGVEYVKKRILRWGRDQGVSNDSSLQRACYV